MLLDKIFSKLKKMQWNKVSYILSKIILFISKPSSIKIEFFSQHIDSPLLKKWLLSHKRQLQNSEYKHFKEIIEKFDQEHLIVPKTKFKIAICISGEPRTFEHCVDSFKRFFNGHDIDIFIASKNQSFQSELSEKYNPKAIKSYIDIDYSSLERLGLEKLGFINLKHNVVIPHANPNILPMWYGIQQSFQCLEESTNPLEYDLICRCRFDTLFKTPMDLEKIHPKSIYLDPNYNEHGGFSDQFAIGTPEVMKTYFNLFDWIPSSLELKYEERGYTPERLLKKYLVDINNINIIEHQFNTRLLRDKFIGLNPHQIPIKSNETNLERNKRIQNYIKKKFPDLYPS